MMQISVTPQMYKEEHREAARPSFSFCPCLHVCAVLNLKRKAEDAFIQQIFIATREWQTAWGEPQPSPSLYSCITVP